MGYRWKPNASQKAEYKEKMQEREKLSVFTTPYAIREGCYVEFYSVNKGKVISGVVINSSYGADRGQHTFTIESDGEKIMVKGRNLYPNMIRHIQGENSKIESRSKGGGVDAIKNLAHGGSLEYNQIVDLFEDYENIPQKVQVILDKYVEDFGEDLSEMDYLDMVNMHNEVYAVGYTFDSGLDNVAFGLRPIGVNLNQLKGYEFEDKDISNELHAKGGSIADENINTFNRGVYITKFGDDNYRVSVNNGSRNFPFTFNDSFKSIKKATKFANKIAKNHSINKITIMPELDSSIFEKGGSIAVTKIKDIPNLTEEIEQGKVTYRGLGI